MVPERGKIHLPFGLFAILTKSDIFFQHAFFNSPTGYGRSGCQNGTVPERGKIHLPLGFFAILAKSEFFFQHAFFDSPNGTADSRTQTETVPRRGKIHLPLGLFENFKDVLAAQVPTGSVACGPDCPRLKDCPGLGDPNTLKSCTYMGLRSATL